MYLCHGGTLYTFGLRTTEFFVRILTRNYLDYAVASIVSGMVVVPILFWVSDVFAVVVDRGAVILSRKLMKF